MILSTYLTTIQFNNVMGLESVLYGVHEVSVNSALNDRLDHLSGVLTGENRKRIFRKIFKEVRQNLRGLKFKEKVVYCYFVTQLFASLYTDIANYWDDNSDPGDPCQPIFTIDFLKLKEVLEILNELCSSLNAHPKFLETFFPSENNLRWFTTLKWGISNGAYAATTGELMERDLHVEITRSFKMEVPKFVDYLLAWKAKSEKLEGFSLETLDSIYDYSRLNKIALYFEKSINSDSR